MQSQPIKVGRLGSPKTVSCHLGGNWYPGWRGKIQDMGVSKNGGTPKSSILIGVSILNHPFGGTPIFGNTHINKYVEILMEITPASPGMLGK